VGVEEESEDSLGEWLGELDTEGELERAMLLVAAVLFVTVWVPVRTTVTETEKEFRLGDDVGEGGSVTPDIWLAEL